MVYDVLEQQQPSPAKLTSYTWQSPFNNLPLGQSFNYKPTCTNSLVNTFPQKPMYHQPTCTPSAPTNYDITTNNTSGSTYAVMQPTTDPGVAACVASSLGHSSFDPTYNCQPTNSFNYFTQKPVDSSHQPTSTPCVSTKNDIISMTSGTAYTTRMQPTSDAGVSAIIQESEPANSNAASPVHHTVSQASTTLSATTTTSSVTTTTSSVTTVSDIKVIDFDTEYEFN